MTRRVAVLTLPFGEFDPGPARALEAAGAELSWNPWGRKPTHAELVAHLAEARPEVVIASTERYDAAALDAAPELRLIARTGVGLDGIDLLAARARGVAVTWTPEGPSDSAAELATGLLLALSRHVLPADRDVRAGRWARRVGWLLRERTVGIVGLGRIGSRVARILAGFGARPLATDVDPAVVPVAAALGVPLVPLGELLSRADAVTLHVPLTEDTYDLLDARTLSLLPRGAFLVNTSRGEVVNEAALIAALDEGRLAGAALDVYTDEPYRGPLAGRDDVVLTCHMGSCTREGRRAMEWGATNATLAWLRGEPLPDRVV
ncbi:MAG: phosphoglycerate dehydrogenase [Planctomycetota bacterium]